MATGEVVVRHLSSHLAATEEVAQSLLFQGSTPMGEKSTPVFEYLAEEVPVFREVGETKAHYSKVSKWPAVGGHVEFRDGWGCSAACG